MHLIRSGHTERNCQLLFGGAVMARIRPVRPWLIFYTINFEVVV